MKFFHQRNWRTAVLFVAILLAKLQGTSCGSDVVILHHPIISTFDGVAYFFDGQNIGDMLYIIKEIKKIYLGTLNPNTKKREGIYSFRGQWHSIHTLAELQDEIAPEEMEQYLALFKETTEEFIRINLPHIETARGTRSSIVQLIEEWITQTGRTSTYLISWNKAKEGHELETFKRDITSFKQFDEFCYDLISLLESIIQSCPKGREQFKEMIRSAKK